jgi:TPR repeat protein
LQSQAHRLEWIEKKEKKEALTPVMAPPEPVAAPQPTLAVPPPVLELSAAQDRLMNLERIEKKEMEEGLMPAVAAPKPTLEVSPFDREQSASLVKRGQERLMNGDIASARLLLKRAANAGDAQAALALGMTFDPDFLAQRGVLGIVADVTQARALYDTAIKRGSTEASRNLERLASTPK